MKVYIASRFADRKRLRTMADKIWALGHEVSSTWLQEVHKKKELTRQEFWEHLARKDFQEISKSDLLIRDVHTISHTGGADIETGFALAQHQNCMVWIVGKPRNVFHTLADKVFPNWTACLKELQNYAVH